VGNPDPTQLYYYRVGYCPVDFYGEFAMARTLLVPGMRQTPERRLIESSGLPVNEIRRMEEQVEKQLSMKALVDAQDVNLVKWFHDNGVPQVVQFDRKVFAYD
jgi:DNA-directed RNA polymerase sigma subunit (sigma70/sigma32)